MFEKSLFCVVATLALSILIGSSSYLEVTRIAVTSRMSLNFGQVRPQIAELAALERLEKSPWTYNGKKNVVASHSSAFIFHWIFFILAGNKDNHYVSDGFEFQPDPTSDCGVSCP